MLHWLVSRPPSLIVFSRSSMLQFGRSPVFVARLVSRTLLPASTGYAHPSEFSSNWRSLSTEVFTARTVPQYLSDLLRRVADISSRRRLRSSLADRLTTSVRPASSLSATAHFLYCQLPHARCGTVCQTTIRHHLCPSLPN